MPRDGTIVAIEASHDQNNDRDVNVELNQGPPPYSTNVAISFTTTGDGTDAGYFGDLEENTDFDATDYMKVEVRSGPSGPISWPVVTLYVKWRK